MDEKGLTLLNLADKYMLVIARVEQEAAENEGEISKELDEELELVLKQMEDKQDAYLVINSSIDKKIEQVKEMRDTLNLVIKRYEKNQASLKERLKYFMQSTGISKISGLFGSVSLREYKKIPESLSLSDVPEEYIKTKTTQSIDKVSLKKDIESGKVTNIELETTIEPVIYKKKSQ